MALENDPLLRRDLFTAIREIERRIERIEALLLPKSDDNSKVEFIDGSGNTLLEIGDLGGGLGIGIRIKTSTGTVVFEEHQ
jgi:hypothetical protein